MQETKPPSASPRRALLAGAATVDITPAGSVFLFGYPHVPRLSTGVHDPLECAALFLRIDGRGTLVLANDLIFVGRREAGEIRRRLAARTGLPEAAIMVTATHTHSGPVMVDYVSNAADPVVPRADERYLELFVERAVTAGVAAVESAQPADMGFAVAAADGIGTNRHDREGPADRDVPVLAVRARDSGAMIACLLVCAMHPTVLHEDSKLISADFPGFARRRLPEALGVRPFPVLFLQGASGNQSPRHVTRANTFAEAQRLGDQLARGIAAALAGARFDPAPRITIGGTRLDLTPRRFPPVAVAERDLEQARQRYEQLRRDGAPRTEVRTAECDVFGAEETVELARAAADGRLAAAMAAATPAEIQAIGVGDWTLVGWPGEFFVEYALALRGRCPGTYVVTMANGELQGYVVTEEAAAARVYEATNAVFAPANGERFVAASADLVRQLR